LILSRKKIRERKEKVNLTYHQQKAAEKEQQILKGALPEFLENGYGGTSMDRIAQAAGVSKQTVYSHFGSKEDLFKALIKKVARDKFQLVWAQPLKGKPEKVLKELAFRLLKEVKNPEHLSFMHLLITESKKHPDLGKLFLANVAKPAMVILGNYFQETQQLSLENPEAIARIFVGTLINFVLTQEMLHGKEIIPISEEILIDTLINLLIDSEKTRGECQTAKNS
jgi:AcrR family transcriptional regulator